MSKLNKFNYNGSDITFDLGKGQVMANATEMSKPFGKQPTHWLNLDNTQDYISSLSKLRNRSLADLVKVKRGGYNPGTWMHEDVAMEFARWLSPEFSIWCNDRIKELLTHGFTATTDKIEDMLADPENWIKTLQELQKERTRRQVAETQYALAEEVILDQAPKVIYHDQVLISESTYTTTTIAKELGTGAPSLHKQLHGMGIIYKTDGHWVLYHQHQNKGYTKTRTATYTDRYGNQQSTITTVWTEKGREWLHRIFNSELS